MALRCRTRPAGSNPRKTSTLGVEVYGAPESEFTFTALRWFQLTPDKVFITRPVDKPDLSKVDEVGFADLMPSGGHGSAGWINVGPIQVYGKPVKR